MVPDRINEDENEPSPKSKSNEKNPKSKVTSSLNDVVVMTSLPAFHDQTDKFQSLVVEDHLVVINDFDVFP